MFYSYIFYRYIKLKRGGGGGGLSPLKTPRGAGPGPRATLVTTPYKHNAAYKNSVVNWTNPFDRVCFNDFMNVSLCIHYAFMGLKFHTGRKVRPPGGSFWPAGVSCAWGTCPEPRGRAAPPGWCLEEGRGHEFIAQFPPNVGLIKLILSYLSPPRHQWSLKPFCFLRLCHPPRYFFQPSTPFLSRAQ